MNGLLTPLTRPYAWDRPEAIAAEVAAAKKAASTRFGILRVACVGPSSAIAEARAAGATTGQALKHGIRAVASGPYRALEAYANVAGHAVTASEQYAREQAAASWAGTLKTVFMPWTQWSRGWQDGWKSLVEQAEVGARIALAKNEDR